MNPPGHFGPVVETMLTLALGLAAIWVALLPWSLAAEEGPAPDLVWCLVAAWTIRRPAMAPLSAILGLGLAADLMLGRPLGLGALALLLSAEALRGHAGALRTGPFAVEWSVVAAMFALCLTGMHLTLQFVFADGPSFAGLLRHAGATALAYPVVVAILNFGLGMRAPRGASRPDRLGRIT